MRIRTLSVYCIAHFAVDFCCAHFMFTLLRDSGNWLYAMLIYNFCAFAMQMPLGLLADKLNRNYAVAAAGCILVAVSSIISCQWFITQMLSAAVMGLGNALFHVGGGVDVLNISEHRCAPLGLFVSPGAIGLCLGAMLKGRFPLYADCAILVLMALLIALPAVRKGRYTDNLPLKFDKITVSSTLCLLCLLAVVCLRSFAGMSFSFEWKSSLPAVVPVLCVAFGKALGGFAADGIGSKLATLLSLGACAVLFLFSGIPLCGLAALLLFNMTMPITLWETAKLFPNAKGFSFGLLTFALFLGFLPVCFGTPSLNAVLSTAAVLLSLLLLLLGIRRKKDVA